MAGTALKPQAVWLWNAAARAGAGSFEAHLPGPEGTDSRERERGTFLSPDASH